MKKMLFHIHSKFSYDCNIEPKYIVDIAVKKKIDYLVICDHDTIFGAIEAKKYAIKEGYNIEIPISAEYLTDIGDIIVVNIPNNFTRIFNHKILCKKVKEFGGYIILPHPFKSHKLDKIDFTKIDFIEVFNSRCSPEENIKAISLAQNMNKKFIYGSDAHFLNDIKNVISIYNSGDPFTEDLVPLKMYYTSKNRLYYSQLIKAKKNNDFKLFKGTTLNIIKHNIIKIYKLLIKLSCK